MTALAWAAPFAALAVCAAWAVPRLRGHKPGCWRRAAVIYGLIIAALLAIAAVRAWRAARHPLRHARYLAARAIRRIPRRDPDGEPLDRDEMRAFIAVVECWRRETAPEPERSRT